MNKLTQFPASIHGYDMFFEKVAQKDLEKIALTHRGICSMDPDFKTVTCKFLEPIVVSDLNGILSILFSVRTSGEMIAKEYSAAYSGGELYITGVGDRCTLLESKFS